MNSYDENMLEKRHCTNRITSAIDDIDIVINTIQDFNLQFYPDLVDKIAELHDKIDDLIHIYCK